MNPEVLAYPFLFVAIFIESFVLVTLLSKPARLARLRRAGGRADANTLPSVAVIVPCYNEAATVAATCESLLALDYPKEKLEIILVDDGSTDATPQAMEQFAWHPQVRIIQKENGGKHTALNFGIAATRDALRNYQIALQNAAFARAADLPVSAYAKDSNISFNITITLKP